MAARASILGDLSEITRPGGASRSRTGQSRRAPTAVELSSVHAVVQFTCGDGADGWQDIGDENHPLGKEIKAFDEKVSAAGVQILSVQCMRRYLAADKSHSRSHFDFADGISQPSFSSLRKRESRPIPT